MITWIRTTRELALENIRPEMTAAIQEHFDTYNLGPILKDYSICIETAANQQKKGLFGGGGVGGIKIPKSNVQVSILTPTWLVHCVQQEGQNYAAAVSIPLESATVEDYRNTPDYNMIKDCGVYITGIFTGKVGLQGNTLTRYFIGLGEEAAANEFKEFLFKFIQKTRK